MVGIECLKKVSPICISKNLGLYLKNINTENEKELVNDLVLEDYDRELERNKKFNKEIYNCFTDDYYNNVFNCDVSKLDIKQLLSLISSHILIFDLIPSKDTIIADDDVFDKYEDENELSKQLSKTPLVNPIDEWEIEHKFLYLFNFIESSKSEKRNDLDEIFYTGYPDEILNIMSVFTAKTYTKRKEWSAIGYEYYDTHNEEYNSKINRIIQFGKIYDKVITSGSDYLKVDFIIETLISAEISQYSLLNYVSLIEMLIVNSKNSSRSEFKRKLKEFIHEDDMDDNDKEYISGLLYDIRSRMIHGDFDKLKKELTKYKKRYMKDFWFDYGEFKEENWIIGSINSFLRHIVSNILYDYFHDNKKICELKKENKLNKKNNLFIYLFRKLKRKN